MNSTTVALINALLYSITSIFFYKKKGFSVGLIIWGLFMISSWTTYFFIQQPLYRFSIHNGELTILPFLYLFATLCIIIYPLTNLKPIKEGAITFTHHSFWKYYMLFVIVVQILSVIINSSAITTALSVTEQTVTDYKDYSYEDTTYIPVQHVPIMMQLNGWLLLALKIFNLGMAFVMYFCYKYERKIVTWYFVSTMLELFSENIIIASRGQLLMNVLFCLLMFFLLYNNVTQKQKKYFYAICIAGAAVLVPFVVTITLGRFGDSAANFFLLKYFGEAMNNFNALLFNDIKGSTDGFAYLLSFPCQMLGMGDFKTTMDKWNFIESNTGVSGQYFYTLVGGSIIEFGKIATIIIAIVLNRIFNAVVKNREHYTLNDMIILMYALYYMMQGLFIFPIQGKGGFLQMTALVFILFYFRSKPNTVYDR